MVLKPTIGFNSPTKLLLLPTFNTSSTRPIILKLIPSGCSVCAFRQTSDINGFIQFIIYHSIPLMAEREDNSPGKSRCSSSAFRQEAEIHPMRSLYSLPTHSSPWAPQPASLIYECFEVLLTIRNTHSEGPFKVENLCPSYV